MDNLRGILVFLNVVDAGTLSGAARALGVSTAAVSATLARLERKLAVRLLDRTTRRLRMTAEGEEFYARCRQIVSDLEAAERAVGVARRAPSGLLRVGMPHGIGRTWIIPHLPRFAREYPGVQLEIVCRDFTVQARESEFDIAVRSGELPPSRLAVRRLATCRYVVCAAPEYWQAHRRPRTPDDLRDHVCLAYRRPRNGRVRQWRFAGPGGDHSLAVAGALTFNSNEALVTAAIAGLGVIQVADFYARQAIDDGDLVEVLADHWFGGYEISVLFPPQPHMTPKHRVFVDFLVDVFSHPRWVG